MHALAVKLDFGADDLNCESDESRYRKKVSGYIQNASGHVEPRLSRSQKYL